MPHNISRDEKENIQCAIKNIGYMLTSVPNFYAKVPFSHNTKKKFIKYAKDPAYNDSDWIPHHSTLEAARTTFNSICHPPLISVSSLFKENIEEKYEKGLFIEQKTSVNENKKHWYTGAYYIYYYQKEETSFTGAINKGILLISSDNNETYNMDIITGFSNDLPPEWEPIVLNSKKSNLEKIINEKKYRDYLKNATPEKQNIFYFTGELYFYNNSIISIVSEPQGYQKILYIKRVDSSSNHEFYQGALIPVITTTHGATSSFQYWGISRYPVDSTKIGDILKIQQGEEYWINTDKKAYRWYQLCLNSAKKSTL